MMATSSQENHKNHALHNEKVYRFFSLMDPMEGAIEAYHWLAGNFDAYILSTVPLGESHGVDRFTGMHIHFETEKFPDWSEVRAFLKGGSDLRNF